MQLIINAFLNHDLKLFIEQIGYIGVFLVLFAESGLLIGFFLPGDSLIFTAGLLAAPSFGFFNIWIILLGAWAAAVIGDNVGYEFGKRAGHKIFHREDSLLFHKDNLIRAQEFYEKHGGKAIILARFIPVVRTFAPIVAGIGHMDHKRFTFFNCIGGAIWVFGLGLAGYFLGELIPDIDNYLFPIIGIIILLSVIPPSYHLYKEHKKTLWQKIKEKIIHLLKYGVFK